MNKPGFWAVLWVAPTAGALGHHSYRGSWLNPLIRWTKTNNLILIGKMGVKTLATIRCIS